MGKIITIMGVVTFLLSLIIPKILLKSNPGIIEQHKCRLISIVFILFGFGLALLGTGKFLMIILGFIFIIIGILICLHYSGILFKVSDDELAEKAEYQREKEKKKNSKRKRKKKILM